MKKISPLNFGGDDGGIKLRRQGRKPLVNFYREPKDAPAFELTDHDWDILERAYRSKVSDSLRNKLGESVEDFFWFFHCAGAKSYADNTRRYLNTIATAAFPPAALAIIPRKPAHAAARDVLLEYYLFDEDEPEKTVVAEDFKNEPDRVRRAAEEMARDIEQKDTAPPTAKPSEWDKMVVELMRALRDANFPYTVNKRGTSKGASPVISLLIGLQEHFPPELRCHVSRDGEADEATIAAAASKAWRDFKRSPSGRRESRERAKAPIAELPPRHERLNIVFKYLESRRPRRAVRTT
jgi:hypothetical protein